MKFRAAGAAAILRRNLLIYGVGGLIAPFIGIKVIDLIITALGVKLMRRQLVPALHIFLVFTVLVGIVYPLAMTGVSQVLFGHQANGSLVKDGDGDVVGSSLLGQTFTGDQYFQTRPSAAGDGYDPTKSGASNLGPTNQQLLDDVAERAAAYRATNGLPSDTQVPVDAVTSSGSGLDPHISVANA